MARPRVRVACDVIREAGARAYWVTKDPVRGWIWGHRASFNINNLMELGFLYDDHRLDRKLNWSSGEMVVSWSWVG